MIKITAVSTSTGEISLTISYDNPSGSGKSGVPENFDFTPYIGVELET